MVLGACAHAPLPRARSRACVCNRPTASDARFPPTLLCHSTTLLWEEADRGRRSHLPLRAAARDRHPVGCREGWQVCKDRRAQDGDELRAGPAGPGLLARRDSETGVHQVGRRGRGPKGAHPRHEGIGRGRECSGTAAGRAARRESTEGGREREREVAFADVSGDLGGRADVRFAARPAGEGDVQLHRPVHAGLGRCGGARAQRREERSGGEERGGGGGRESEGSRCC